MIAFFNRKTKLKKIVINVWTVFFNYRAQLSYLQEPNHDSISVIQQWWIGKLSVKHDTECCLLLVYCMYLKLKENWLSW